MKKETKKVVLITTILTLLPILVGLLLWNQLPDQMATHFDGAGEANGWSSKYAAVFGLPLFVAAVNAIVVICTEKDPKRAAYPKKMMKLLYAICPVVSWVCAAAVYGYAIQVDTSHMTQWLMVFAGVLFVVIGNYLPKVKQNLFLGIKLPWTYADEENWNKTHRMTGKLWVAGGLILVINAFLQIQGVDITVMILMAVVPLIYSYLYSRRLH